MISVMKNLLGSVFHKTFGYLLLLTVFFVFIEIAFFILCNNSYLYVFSFVANRMSLPAAILPGIFYFAFAQLVIHLLYTVAVCLFSTLLIKQWRISPENYLSFSMKVWFAGIITILLANGYYYPNSHFAQLGTAFMSVTVLKYILMGALLSWAMLGAWVFIKLINNFILLLLSLSVFALLIFWPFSSSNFSSAATVRQPNVIIIGVDSLRPDILELFGGEAQTPFLTDFMQQTTLFGEALTPLARTYPSWVGILSGLYPAKSGVRTNLSGTASLNLEQTLPSLLRQQGYESIYATDETRFSNIDKQFGFDQVITPPMGLNDFLLGSFNDFPLSNLVVNTHLGKWLFPYSYGNRPAYATYQPDSFLQLLKPTILRNHQKPLFLAVHFCLPHHPYVYDRMQNEQITGQERYVQSVVRADQQLQDFFKMLQQAHLLDHAIVVLLSDHGEALELRGDRITEKAAYLPRHSDVPVFYPPSENKLAMDQAAGHGTDVLSLPQYHSLLAFRLYGVGKQAVGIKSGVVSLLDIKPTVLDLLASAAKHQISPNPPFSKEGAEKLFEKEGLENYVPPFEKGGPGGISNQSKNKGPREISGQSGETSNQGISLARYIKNLRLPLPSRMFFLESDYSPEAVRSVYPNVSKVILEGANLFQIDPYTTRLMVKKETVEMILKSKQYAVIYKDWVLALYPQSNGSKTPVLVNLRTGNWTTDLSSFFAKTSPATKMEHALRQMYLR